MISLLALVARHVLAHARKGDISDAIRDEKGLILDGVRRLQRAAL
jgi:hypothetical protein